MNITGTGKIGRFTYSPLMLEFILHSEYELSGFVADI